MTVTSKVDICNMALSHLGNYGTVSNIDTPTNSKEITFSLWYDIARQSLLKLVMPNFALGRQIVAQDATAPTFGYAYAYAYPSGALKVLGIGEAQDKLNDYAVEGNLILTDNEYADGMPVRYIKDVTDINQMSPEFKVLLSWHLAEAVALDITQDVNKANAIAKGNVPRMASVSGTNAQENMPIRISRSRFKAARRDYDPRYQSKK